jgi:hypothetical protein
MPLEQTALAPKGVQRGPWTDVFGISGLAAFMLTGQSPATARRQPTTPLINTTARQPRAAAPETLPRAMMAAIRVSLLPNARQRPQDIAQLKAMMGLFATAPVLSDELKAALAAPAAPPRLPRSGLHMPAEPAADAPVRPSDAGLVGRRERGSTGSTVLARARDSGFGNLTTAPMPLRPLADEPAPRQDAAKALASDAKPEAFPAYRELPAWDGDEPLPPDPAVRRRKLSAGAAAAGAAMVAIAALWVFVDSPPKTQDPAAIAAALQARDMERMLKATPPAAGGPPSTPTQTSPPEPALPSAVTAAPATVAAVVSSPSATAPIRTPPMPEPQTADSTIRRDVPASQARAPVLSPMPSPAPGAGESTSRLAERPAAAPRAASKPPVAFAHAQPGEGRPSPAARGPSCSQILLEQSLGARVSAADVRNCR